MALRLNAGLNTTINPSMTLNNSSTSGTQVNMEDSGNLADNEASRDTAIGLQGDCGDSSTRVFMTCFGRDVEDHLEKLLECPVCYDVILPPIICCVAGHSCCGGCRQSLHNCPVCRGNFTEVRNLFAEQFMEKCLVKCKHRTAGCLSVLPARELAIHYQETCEYRQIHCRECDSLVMFEEYLDHIRTKDKIERQKASECSTGFEIDDLDLYTGESERQAVWEPTWMYCYGHNFFCSLEHKEDSWWIWISSLASEGCKYKGQVILWNKDKGTEVSYTGTIHSIRVKPDEVFKSGECLIIKDKVLKDFLYQGGIDVLVRIERIYNPPKTRRGLEVESPLAAANRDRLKGPSPAVSTLPSHELPAFVTPSRTLRSNAREATSGTSFAASIATGTRIPTAVDTRSPLRHAGVTNAAISSVATGSEESGPRLRAGGLARRVLFNNGQNSPIPPRTRNTRQAIVTRRTPSPQQDVEIITVDDSSEE